ncbi:MAG: hypothetical protein D6712_05965 [Chloroflexi bacterium]|nr:MAG: hypothetical protein D6712_05965 [Chloroflexota bacterium]
MDLVSLNRFFALYSWFVLAIVVFFIALIARFYQRFSNKNTYFRYFPLPIILFGVSAVRYGSINRIAGDAVADIAAAIGGGFLILLLFNLYRCMLKS